MKNSKITIIGAGNLGKAIARGIVKAKLTEASNIVLTRRHEEYLESLRNEGFQVSSSNVDAVKGSKLVVLAVQPKQLQPVLEEINPIVNPEIVVVSVITGVSISDIEKALNPGISVIRAMPNTAIAVGESITCLASNENGKDKLKQVERIFSSVGDTLVIDEPLMQAATVLGASGVAFFMRYLRAATQGGIQMGFHPEEAQKIAVQTAKGASQLIIENISHPELEIDKVTTPRGCTIEGLNEMEHQGFSSSLIRGLMTSFNKINNIT